MGVALLVIHGSIRGAYGTVPPENSKPELQGTLFTIETGAVSGSADMARVVLALKL